MEADEDNILQNTSIDSRKFIMTSAFTGICENALFYPFEYLKTRQQALDIAPPFHPHDHSFAANQTSPATKISRQPSLTSQITQTLATSGPRGLFRGFSWFAMANVPADMIYLYGYAMCKQTLYDTSFGQRHPTLVHMFSGAAGDFFSIVLVVPLEVVAQRLQIQDHLRATLIANPQKGVPIPKLQNGFQIFWNIAKQDGRKGLFKGTGMSLLLFLPSSATWWGVSESAKKPAAKFLGVDEKNPMAHALAGACAGLVTSVMMNPVDVVKTRLQTSKTKVSAFGVVKDLFQNGGILSFTRGILPRMLGAVPRSALAMVIFQFIVGRSQKDPPSPEPSAK